MGTDRCAHVHASATPLTSCLPDFVLCSSGARACTMLHAFDVDRSRPSVLFVDLPNSLTHPIGAALLPVRAMSRTRRFRNGAVCAGRGSRLQRQQLSSPVCLSVCLSVCLPACLPHHQQHLCVHMSARACCL